ncbi:MAG: ABC transporter ATP-binding protein [Thermodesulfobacteriota bacterium]
MLEVRSIHFSYGQARVLEDVSLSLAPGEAACLLGMNGAGKTTLLNILSGLLKPAAGQVLLDGAPAPRGAAARVRAGVVQAPEGRQVFAPLTVRENLEMGAYLRLRSGKKAEVAADLERMLELFPALRERLRQEAGKLSGGEQQMLAMARALMARPRYLLLDEPSLGLSPKMAAEIFRVVRDLPATGCGVLLVEQNALGALAVSSRGYILTTGRIRFSGAPRDIACDPQLREAFLGPDQEAAP